jgi:predicted ATPase/DNA-binding SARP family transcriptional activator
MDLDTKTQSVPADVEIFLLGGFVVRVQGQAVPSRSWRLRRAQQLVKLLALHPQHALAPEVILEQLWNTPDAAPMRHSLHQVVYAARRGLSVSRREPALVWENDLIAFHPRLALWMDVEAFESAARAARHAPTLDHYHNALALYRGDLLPEDRYAEWTLARREALRELHLALSVELAELYEQQSADANARTLLESIVAADPLREDAHRALMRIYARAGQRALALHQYQIARAHLARELGVEPEAATQQLHDALRAKSDTLSDTSNLPHALTSFIGRDADAAVVQGLLRQGRLVTLTGPGGAGKTRLALHCAHVAARVERVYWIELAALADAALVPNVIAAGLNIQEQGADSIQTRILRVLREAPTLLVLDNCEHLLDAAAQFARNILRQCPHLRILTTSREPLRVAGEQLWQVTPLAFPPALDASQLAALNNFDAVRLFVERARAVVPSFALTPDNAPAVADVCRRLDGLPLALELAAARVNVLSVQQIDAALDDALRVLIAGERAQLPRHQTMRAAIEWSYALLSDAEAKLWARLAVFAGGFTLEAAQAIFAAQDAPRVLDVLSALVAKSMVQAQPWQQAMRYSLLEVMRQSALEKLNASGETALLRAQHGAYYLGFAEHANRELMGAGQVEWVLRLSADMDNLRAALEWARQDAGTEDALTRFGAALWRFWYARGWLSEGQHWLELALARAHTDSVTRAQVLVGLGALLWAQSDFVRAVQFCEAALELATRVNDLSGVAWAELLVGMIAQSRGALAEAADWEIRSLRHFETNGEAFGKAMTFHALGVTAHTRGDLASAREFFAASLNAHRALGNPWGAAMPLYALGVIAQGDGDAATAEKFFQESYALFGAVDSHLGLGLNASNLGMLASEGGELERAAQWLDESYKHFEKMGDHLGMARTWRGRAQLALRRGEMANARAVARQSLQICAQFGDQVSIAESLETLARVAIAQNAFASAVQWASAAERLREQLGAPPFPADAARDEKMLRQARQELGELEYERAWTEGQTVELDEIVRMVLTE